MIPVRDRRKARFSPKSFSQGSDAQAAAKRYEPHPLVRMQRARLASRTPRRTGLLEQKTLWRSVFDCIRGEVGSRGSADLAVRSNSAKECDDTLAVAAQSLGAGSLSGSGMEPPGRRVVQLLYPDLWAYNFKSGRFSI